MNIDIEINILQIYTSTGRSKDEQINDLYEQLEQILKAVKETSLSF